MSSFTLLGVVLLLLLLQLLIPRLLELFEVALVVCQLRVVEVDYFVHNCVQEVSRMGHDDYCDVELLDIFLKPSESIKI